MKNKGFIYSEVYQGPMVFAKDLMEEESKFGDVIRVVSNRVSGGVGLRWSTEAPGDTSVDIIRRVIAVLTSIVDKSDTVPAEELSEVCNLLLEHFPDSMQQIKSIYMGEDDADD